MSLRECLQISFFQKKGDENAGKQRSLAKIINIELQRVKT